MYDLRYTRDDCGEPPQASRQKKGFFVNLGESKNKYSEPQKYCVQLLGFIIVHCSLFLIESVYYALTNNSFPTPHNGHFQSSGSSSKGVPGAIPLSGSPSSGLYSYPQTSQIYLSIGLFFVNVSLDVVHDVQDEGLCLLVVRVRGVLVQRNLLVSPLALWR